MAGRIQAGYMLAPLVMDLADKGIPVKIVSLGHRSGAVIMVRTDSAYENFAQLKGKRIAIPSRFAVDFLFLRKMLARENMTPKDIEIIEMPPPDMPAALYANAVDAYCTGEPFGAASSELIRPVDQPLDNAWVYIFAERFADALLVTQLLDHPVEGGGQVADLVLRGDGKRLVEMTRLDRARALEQTADWTRHAAADQDRKH